MLLPGFGPMSGFSAGFRGLLASNNKAIANLLTSGADVNLHIFGDSRSIYSFANRCMPLHSPVIAWGGLATRFESANTDADAWLHTISNSPSNDDRGTCASASLSGRYTDEFFPGGRVSEIELIAGGTTSATAANACVNYSSLQGNATGTLALATARGITQGAQRRVIHTLCGVSGTITQARSLQQNSGATTVVRSAVTAVPTDESYTLLSTSFDVVYDYVSDYAACGLDSGVTVASNAAMVAGPVVLKAASGVTLFSWSVSGRSIDGWLDNNLLSTKHLTQLLPAYASALSATNVVWIDLGANNPAGNTTAQHAAKLRQLISKIRASLGASTPIMLCTQYDFDGDTGYHVQACLDVADTTPGVACFDTHSALPTYAARPDAYTDTIHYNLEVGAPLYAHALGDLIYAAADKTDELNRRQWLANVYEIAGGAANIIQASVMADSVVSGSDITALRDRATGRAIPATGAAYAQLQSVNGHNAAVFAPSASTCYYNILPGARTIRGSVGVAQLTASSGYLACLVSGGYPRLMAANLTTWQADAGTTFYKDGVAGNSISAGAHTYAATNNSPTGTLGIGGQSGFAARTWTGPIWAIVEFNTLPTVDQMVALAAANKSLFSFLP